MNLYIITGTSKGLGRSIASKLISKDNRLLCISRSINKELIKYAEKEDCTLDYIHYDLSVVDGIERVIDKFFNSIDLVDINKAVLINNAAVIEPIKTIDKCIDNEIINNVNVNLIAPMILTSNFIRRLKNIGCDKRIINISSGAARKPYYGWSNYNATKAGLDLFTQSVALESNVKIVSLAPFIMDTGMQDAIRNSDKEDFKELDRFIKFKDDNILLSPDVVAEKVVKLLDMNVPSGDFVDVRTIE